MTSEDRLIDWLRRRLRRRGVDLVGDDAALLPGPPAPVVSVDQQIAGTHFPADLAPPIAARRLVAVTLSDLAAMGAEPAWALLALGVPPGLDPRPFLRALLSACDGYGLTLAGGDLARTAVLSAALTVHGRRRRGGRLVGRGGARPGDALWLGGPLGESAAGRLLLARGARFDGRAVRLPRELGRGRSLAHAARRAVRRHLAPRPQLELGAWLARRRRAAAIDVSDGLALDLHRLCRAGRVGARIDAGRLPRPPGLDALAARLGHEAPALVLGGGEDYVLLFTLAAGSRPPERFGARRIGEVLPAAGRVEIEESGRRRRLPARGWDHLAAPDRPG